MAGFYLYSSNQQEILAEHLAYLLQQQPLAGALAPEVIMVQNHGMQRWVSLQVALHLGIEANTRYIFPNELLQLVFSRVIPDYQNFEMPSKDEIAWAVMAALSGKLSKKQFAPLDNYLKDGSPIKSYQLAFRVAGLFDQYAMFRPEMLMKWTNSRGDNWQSQLWQALPAALRDRQKPVLREKFFQHAKQVLSKKHTLPERVSIFGISALPPLHIDMLAALSEYIDVHFFLCNPTEHYWGDVLSEKELLRTTDRNLQSTISGAVSSAEEVLPEQGNPLLASWGRYARGFSRMLIDRDLLSGLGESCFQCPGDEFLLQRLQRDIYLLENPTATQDAKIELNPADRSLTMHSCHSPMREVEVLHDQLLYLLDTNPDLKPSDIVVMTPEIETYAPLIQSVFRRSGNARESIPYSLADYSLHREGKAVESFFRLLDLAESRFAFSEIFEILESKSIRSTFMLSENDVAVIQELVQAANIRWGVDPVHRAAMGTPAVCETTWEFGIDRILTGYALPTEESALFEGILPFDDIEGGKAQVFGGFLDFFECLKRLVTPSPLYLDVAHSLPDWADVLRAVIGEFFTEEAVSHQELSLLRSVIDDLKKVDEPNLQVDVEVINRHLREKMKDLTNRGGFLGFGVTFCSMMPMRAIPFQVVALLGMNDRAFPRLDKSLSFDLMQNEHRLGDRSLKDEDRYLFLETLLSCRRFMYISYVGQSIKDNSMLSPSTLVAELIDYIEKSYRVAGSSINDFLVVRHPLQPFSPRYFQEQSGLVSYSHENLAAAMQLQKREDHGFPLFDVNLGEPESEFLEVDVERLVGFFANPAGFLFNKRLNLFLADEENATEDDEPFILDGLDRYMLQSELVETTLHKGDLAEQKQICMAKGDLPLSQAGSLAYDDIAAEAKEFASEITRHFLQGEELVPFVYDFTLHDFHLRGVIPSFRADYLVRFRPSGIKATDRIRIWLEQLICNYLEPAGYPRAALLIGLEKKTKTMETLFCPAIENPEEDLLAYLTCYWQGLSRPLPFFPRTANTFMETLMQGDTGKARERASAAWQGSDYYPGEMKQNEYFTRCFQGVDIFSQTEFEKITRMLLTPVYRMQQEWRDED